MYISVLLDLVHWVVDIDMVPSSLLGAESHLWHGDLTASSVVVRR